MQGFAFTLVLLFTFQSVHMSVIASLGADQNVDPFDFPAEGCWFKDKICDTAPGTLVTGDESTFNNPTLCRQKCLDAGESSCKAWTFLVVAGTPECYLLPACYDATNHCTPSVDDASKCASGLNPCPTVCTKLNYDGSKLNREHWYCGGDSPYSHDVEDGSSCFIDCETWTNSVGGDPTKVSSTCVNGDWTDPTPNTVSDSAEPPVAVGKPSDTPDPTCGCQKITIKANSLGEGVELYEKASADGGYEVMDLNNPVEIKTGSSYIMFCDRHLALEINCARGKWSENIQDCTDIYCWDKPGDVSECDGTTL